MTIPAPHIGYSWVRPVTAVLVCGLSCRAPMNSFMREGKLWFGCAEHCERRQPVLAADVAEQLLRTVAQLRCMAGVSDEDRLCRIGEVVTQVSVCTHGKALSVRWLLPAPPRPVTAESAEGAGPLFGGGVWLHDEHPITS